MVNNAPATEPAAPRTAWEAAQQLAAQGHHVHLVAEAQSVCVSQHCHTTDA